VQHIKWPLVLVEWMDSCEPEINGQNAEIPIPDEIPEPQTIISVGHLIRETETYVTLAGGWKPDLDTADYVITILKGSVVGKVERLELISRMSGSRKSGI